MAIRTKQLPMFVALAIGATLATAPAHASWTADGITYSLTKYSTSNPLVDQFLLGITGINAATDTEGGRSGVNAIAFNTLPGFASATMITPPSGYTFVSGGLNAGGCDGSGNFFCFDNTAIPPIPTTPYAANSSLSFMFDVTLSSGNFTGYDPSFKIDWVGSKRNYDLVSHTLGVTDGGSSVPEPASMALLGTGLAGIGWINRRRKRA